MLLHIANSGAHGKPKNRGTSQLKSTSLLSSSNSNVKNSIREKEMTMR